MPFTDPFVANPFPFSIALTLTNASPSTYNVTTSLVSGVYTISWSGGGTLNIDFYNSAGALITSTSGTSSITVNLAQASTYFKAWTSVGGISIIISLSGLAVAPVSGTLYTYTASGTPGLKGDAYVVLVGGGGGSSAASGSTGGIVFGRVNLVGNEVLTIGTPGTPVVAGGVAGNGTATTFAGLTAPGGNGANNTTPGAAVTGGAPGVYNAAGIATSSLATISGLSFFTQGTTGSGGSQGGQFGAGSGVGTGGGPNAAPNASGYGASGWGPNTAILAGTSTGGVAYIVI